MKKAKVSLLALSVLAGGSLATLAAPAPNTGTDVDVIVSWDNASPIFFVTDAPLPDASNATFSATLLQSSVTTDGSGKIDGAAIYRLSLGASGSSTNTNSVVTGAVADIVCSVTGNVTLKGTSPTANINIKGNGASIDSSGAIGVANMSLKFTGTAAASGTNNPGGATFTGTFSGTIKAGLSSVNNNKPIKVTSAAGSADGQAEPLVLNAQVVQSNSKLYAMGSVGIGPFGGIELLGNGNLNTKAGKYTLNTSGFGFSKGSTLNLSGTTSLTTNVWVIVGGTNLTQGTVIIPAKADAKGKLAGQTVKVTGGTVLPLPGVPGLP